jgi:hypothetical protein
MVVILAGAGEDEPVQGLIGRKSYAAADAGCGECAFARTASSPKCAWLKFANCRVAQRKLIYAICTPFAPLRASHLTVRAKFRPSIAVILRAIGCRYIRSIRDS